MYSLFFVASMGIKTYSNLLSKCVYIYFFQKKTQIKQAIINMLTAEAHGSIYIMYQYTFMQFYSLNQCRKVVQIDLIFHLTTNLVTFIPKTINK